MRYIRIFYNNWSTLYSHTPSLPAQEGEMMAIERYWGEMLWNVQNQLWRTHYENQEN
jgi:hypothetical protein